MCVCVGVCANTNGFVCKCIVRNQSAIKEQECWNGSRLELSESLLLLFSSGTCDLEQVETNCLGQWAALTNNNFITQVNTESRADVHRQVGVTTFVTVVLGNVVQVFTTDDDSTLHLGGDHTSWQDTTTNGNQTGPWALFVNVLTINGSTRGLETKTDILVPTLGSGRLAGSLGVQEDGLLKEAKKGKYVSSVFLATRNGHFGKRTFWKARSDWTVNSTPVEAMLACKG